MLKRLFSGRGPKLDTGPGEAVGEEDANPSSAPASPSKPGFIRKLTPRDEGGSPRRAPLNRQQSSRRGLSVDTEEECGGGGGGKGGGSSGGPRGSGVVTSTGKAKSPPAKGSTGGGIRGGVSPRGGVPSPSKGAAGLGVTTSTSPRARKYGGPLSPGGGGGRGREAGGDSGPPTVRAQPPPVVSPRNRPPPAPKGAEVEARPTVDAAPAATSPRSKSMHVKLAGSVEGSGDVQGDSGVEDKAHKGDGGPLPSVLLKPALVGSVGPRQAPKSGNIQVLVRVRPVNPSEKDRGLEPIVACMTDGIQVTTEGQGDRPVSKLYRFQGCAGAEVGQEEFFNRSGVMDMLDTVLEGYSATVFAYGQTGSGKTHTMSGYEDTGDAEGSLSVAGDTVGIIPRSAKYLFERIEELRQASPDMAIKVVATFCEVYNEQVYDLLDLTNDVLAVKWDAKAKTFVVTDLLPVECPSFDDIITVVAEGYRNRRIGSTALNKESSRSHSMLTVRVEMECGLPGDKFRFKKHGKMVFVDLAGSEREAHSLVQGSAAKETRNINLSLLCLGKVISVLANIALKRSREESGDRPQTGRPRTRGRDESRPRTRGGKEGGGARTGTAASLLSPRGGAKSLAGRRAGSRSTMTSRTAGTAAAPTVAHVPYRDSMLTRLLMDSLGGSALTLMIACVSPLKIQLDDTMNTLNYAMRASTIKNKPTVQMGETELLIVNLKTEIAQLRADRQRCTCIPKEPTDVGSPAGPHGLVTVEEHAATMRENGLEILRLCNALEATQAELERTNGRSRLLWEENEELRQKLVYDASRRSNTTMPSGASESEEVAQLRQALDGMSLKCEHLTNKLLLYTNGRRSSQTVSSVEATSGRVDGVGAPPELQRRTSAPKPKDAVSAAGFKSMLMTKRDQFADQVKAAAYSGVAFGMTVAVDEDGEVGQADDSCQAQGGRESSLSYLADFEEWEEGTVADGSSPTHTTFTVDSTGASEATTRTTPTTLGTNDSTSADTHGSAFDSAVAAARKLPAASGGPPTLLSHHVRPTPRRRTSSPKSCDGSIWDALGSHRETEVPVLTAAVGQAPALFNDGCRVATAGTPLEAGTAGLDPDPAFDAAVGAAMAEAPVLVSDLQALTGGLPVGLTPTRPTRDSLRGGDRDGAALALPQVVGSSAVAGTPLSDLGGSPSPRAVANGGAGGRVVRRGQGGEDLPQADGSAQHVDAVPQACLPVIAGGRARSRAAPESQRSAGRGGGSRPEAPQGDTVPVPVAGSRSGAAPESGGGKRELSGGGGPGTPEELRQPVPAPPAKPWQGKGGRPRPVNPGRAVRLQEDVDCQPEALEAAGTAFVSPVRGDLYQRL